MTESEYEKSKIPVTVALLIFQFIVFLSLACIGDTIGIGLGIIGMSLDAILIFMKLSDYYE